MLEMGFAFLKWEMVSKAGEQPEKGARLSSEYFLTVPCRSFPFPGITHPATQQACLLSENADGDRAFIPALKGAVSQESP